MRKISLKKLTPILKILCFLIIFIFIYEYLTQLMRPNDLVKNMAGYYGEEKNTLDMVYIGGSACHTYWAPLQAYEEYGFATYDYCYSAIFAESYKYLVKEVLKSQNPELIIIDARAFQYRKERFPTEAHYRGTITGMDFSKNKLDFINNNVSKTLKMGRLSFVFDLIKYHRSLLSDDINDDAIDMMFHKYKNNTKGFRFIYNIEKLEKKDFYTDKITPIDKESENILLDFLKYIKTTNNKYLFIISSYQEEMYQKEQYNYIKKIVESNGYQFLDTNEYYDKIGLDFNKDLYDLDHVNIFGAEKYTKFLSEYIKETYNLKDRRKDKKYKEWDNLLENWHSQVEYTKEFLENKTN